MHSKKYLTQKYFCLLIAALLAGNVHPSNAQPSKPVDKYVIEDGESRNPATYYDEKPPLIELSSDQKTEGKSSVHFRTGNAHGSGYFTRYLWPQPQNFSDIAKNGSITFDLWVDNSAHLTEPDMGGPLFDFVLGSREQKAGKADEHFVTWYIDSTLLTPNQWNHVTLRISDGAPKLNGSSINGRLVTSTKTSSVVNDPQIDWTHINYSRLGLHVNAPVEGYLDNMTAQVFHWAEIPADVLTLASQDPDPHLLQARAEDTVNAYPSSGESFLPYEIISPDVRKDAFFNNSEDVLQWPTAKNWKAAFRGCKNEVFALSDDQAIRGKKNLKVEFEVTGAEYQIELTPPQPIVAKSTFNTFEWWLFGQYHRGATVTLTFRRPDGSELKWTDGTEEYGNGVWFENWTLAHVVLPETLPAGTALIKIGINPPGPGKYLFHFDQMRFLDIKPYLASRPLLTFSHAGPPVNLPVQPSGARPTTQDTVTNSVTLRDGTGVLEYDDTHQKVRYVLHPSSGTLSDLTVETTRNGQTSTMQPAHGSGPQFAVGNQMFHSGDAGFTAEFLGMTLQDNTLRVSWKYNFPGGETTLTYVFSIHGKTLQLDVDGAPRNVAAWLFGGATDLQSPKIINMPFMSKSPNLLVDDGNFISYFADWYQSNVSTTGNTAYDEVKGSTARYSFRDPSDDTGYSYLPRTDGTRLPFKERFYITASERMEDCLPNISNPVSPYKKVLSTHLYRMISPNKNWVDITQKNLDMYHEFGMDDLFVLFHAGLFSTRGGRGAEPWHSRLNVSVATPGGLPAVQKLFKDIKTKGMTPGIYSGFYFTEPISRVWNYDAVALHNDYSWEPTWVQSYHIKPWYFAELTATFTPQQEKLFGMGINYEDGWTTGPLFNTNDYDARYPEAGSLAETLRAVSAGYRNERAAINGPVISEGDGDDYRSAGLNDGDYGKLPGFANGKSPEEKRIPLLVDFALRKLNPHYVNVSLDIGYTEWSAQSFAKPNDFKWFHQFLAQQIAYGTEGMMEPYSNIKADPTTDFQWTLTSYYMMRQLQQRYIMEPVDIISYFNGKEMLSSSEALSSGDYAKNFLHVKYRNGLEMYINGNWDKQNWKVSLQGRDYLLPPGGWVAAQGNNFLEYSALVNGSRVDYVNSPDYQYLNGWGQEQTEGNLTSKDITIRFKTGNLAGKSKKFPDPV